MGKVGVCCAHLFPTYLTSIVKVVFPLTHTGTRFANDDDDVNEVDDDDSHHCDKATTASAQPPAAAEQGKQQTGYTAIIAPARTEQHGSQETCYKLQAVKHPTEPAPYMQTSTST